MKTMAAGRTALVLLLARGRGVPAARKQALQAHDAEQQVVQPEGLDALADGVRLRAQEERAHRLQRLEDLPVLLRPCRRWSLSACAYCLPNLVITCPLVLFRSHLAQACLGLHAPSNPISRIVRHSFSFIAPPEYHHARAAKKLHALGQPYWKAKEGWKAEALPLTGLLGAVSRKRQAA